MFKEEKDKVTKAKQMAPAPHEPPPKQLVELLVGAIMHGNGEIRADMGKYLLIFGIRNPALSSPAAAGRSRTRSSGSCSASFSSYNSSCSCSGDFSWCSKSPASPARNQPATTTASSSSSSSKKSCFCWYSAWCSTTAASTSFWCSSSLFKWS